MKIKLRKGATAPVMWIVPCLGVAIAVNMSMGANHSILWAIVHGLLNWIYVIYRALGCGGMY